MEYFKLGDINFQKRARLFLFALLLSFSLISQNRDIDSLKTLLRFAKNDTSRCTILNALFTKESDLGIVSKYAKELKDIVDKNLLIETGNTELHKFYLVYLGKSYSNFGVNSLIKGEYNTDAEENFKKSISIARDINDKEGLAGALSNIGALYAASGKNDEALKCYTESAKLFEEINKKIYSATILYNIGIMYDNMSDVLKAYDYQEKALKLRLEINDKDGITRSYSALGDLTRKSGNVIKAIELLEKALKIAEENKFKSLEADIQNNIGGIYMYQGEKDKALEYFKKALKINEAFGDKWGIATSLNNIGTLLFYKGDFKSAEGYYARSLKIREEIGDKQGQSFSYSAFASVYFKNEEYTKAIEYNLKALKLADEINNKGQQVASFIKLSQCYFKLNDIANSQKNAQLAFDLSKEIGFPEHIRDAAKQLKDIYKKKNDPVKALEMYELFSQMRDSINNKETRKASVKSQLKYEFEKKEAILIEKQEKETAVANEKQHTQKIIIWSIIGGLSLVIIFAIFIFNRLQITRKQKLIIENQKTEVDQKNHIIEEKQKEIIDSINYAKRIQNTLLAHEDFLESNTLEHFVFFQPKDIVSGDFYWASKKGNKFYLAVCDSTGHGVPGAFMSLLNIGYLTEAINEKDIKQPNKVLDFVRQRLIDNISKDGQKDGFDGILICIDTSTKQISYAAANNGPILISNDSIIEFDADRMPVGMGERKEGFKLYTIEAKQGDTLFLYTDGYADQFGGPKGKKFKYKPLNALILANSKMPFAKQKDELRSAFENWRGSLEQVDDVCIIGIKL